LRQLQQILEFAQEPFIFIVRANPEPKVTGASKRIATGVKILNPG
jgi:hypothetical protein